MRGLMELGVRRHTPDIPWTYATLDHLQRERAEQIRAGGPGLILLSEVAPVITLGRRASAELGAHLLWKPEHYPARGITLLETGRGGFATYHGPGQWVLFVIDRLERLTGDRRGVRLVVEGLLEVARTALEPWESGAQIRMGSELGVWSAGGGKLASLGIEIDRGVLLHGIAVNGYRVTPAFEGLRACGLDAQPAFAFASDAKAHQNFDILGERLAQTARKTFSRS